MNKHIISRIAELAGDDVARKIKTEYDGEAIYISRLRTLESHLNLPQVEMPLRKTDLRLFGNDFYSVTVRHCRLASQRVLARALAHPEDYLSLPVSLRIQVETAARLDHGVHGAELLQDLYISRLLSSHDSHGHQGEVPK